MKIKIIAAVIVLIMTSFSISFSWQMEEIWRVRGETDSSQYGNCVVSAGDMNHDGYEDFLIAAVGLYIPGKVYLYLGGDSLDTLPYRVFEEDTVFPDGSYGNDFGIKVYGNTDINNDGWNDIFISGCFQGTLKEPRLYLYYGSEEMDTIPDWTFEDTNDVKYFGAVSNGPNTGYDINGDSIDDLVLSTYIDGHNDKVYIFFGGESLSSEPDMVLGPKDVEGQNWFGESIDISGDFNGDGYNDILIGNPVRTGAYPGYLYIYYGGLELDTIVDWTISARPYWWEDCSFFGDVNRDGFDDICLSYETYEGYIGWSAIYYGGEFPDTIIDDSLNYLLSYRVDDLNGDGARDFVSEYIPGVQVYNYQVYLFRSNKPLYNTVDFSSPYYWTGSYGSDDFATADVNGDGCSDLIIGMGYGRGKAFFLAGDSLNVGINENDNTKLTDNFKVETIYPNPFSKEVFFNINSNKGQILNLKVFNLKGDLIDEKNIRAQDKEMVTLFWKPDVSITSGIYIVTVSNEKNIKKSFKTLYLK